MKNYNIKPIQSSDRKNLLQFIRQYWGSDKMVSRGRVHNTAEEAGFLAQRDGKIIGFITYEIRNSEMEITLLDSREREQGLGTALIDRVIAEFKKSGCKRLWLISTNDNMRAIQFYQKRGFDMVKFHRNAVEESRKLKPTIPETGFAGIPINHELEFEYNP